MHVCICLGQCLVILNQKIVVLSLTCPYKWFRLYNPRPKALDREQSRKQQTELSKLKSSATAQPHNLSSEPL